MTALDAARIGVGAVAAQSGVLVVRSELTDVRALRAWLAGRQVRFEDHVLHMADAAQRTEFRELCAQTGWQTLPQIFIDGRFIGGESELRTQLAARESAPSTPAIAPRRTMQVLNLLGYLSAVPFLFGALALIWADAAQASLVEQLLVGYGAVILSFLGAVHWGRVLDAEPEQRVSLAIGLLTVTPALVGWGTLLLPVQISIPLQALLFSAIYAVDRVALRELALGGWYVRLRNRLTFVVVSLLLVAWAAVLH